MDYLLLAGDVGGTKTALALVSLESGTEEVVAEATFDSRRYSGLEEIVLEFLTRQQAQVRWASFSVAGPVIGGRAWLSNLKWEVDAERLASEFDLAGVRLMNDLQATSYALPALAPEQILTLQEGEPVSDGIRAVIAPGTGLGEAFLLPSSAGYDAYPSEGGNADFAPSNALQTAMLHYLQEQDGHVSYEHVCSGRGIPNIYRFLKASGTAEEPTWLAERLAQVEDATPTIVECGMAEDAPEICSLTLDLFASILAAEAGNLALRMLATGGVYLGGGIPPRILDVLRKESFLEDFRRKGHFEKLLRRIPLHVILEPRAALLGAARYGVELSAAESEESSTLAHL